MSALAIVSAIVVALLPAGLAILGSRAMDASSARVDGAGRTGLRLAGGGDPAFEACCLADGACVEVEVASELCVAIDGVPQGGGTICEFAGCRAACCFPGTADCLEGIGFGDCEKMGGVFGGFGTDCEPNPCGDPVGACCLPDGVCIPDVTENFCGLTVAGQFQGVGSLCNEGACCPGDTNGDGSVDFEDLVLVLSAWGACPPIVDCPLDLDDDGIVGFTDITFVLSFFNCG